MGFSKRKFCKKLEISKDSLCRWKNGSFPNVETLIDMEKFFGCPVDELLEKEKVANEK